jgi:serine/threonine protein kinase
MMVNLGNIVGHKYRLEREICKGGMGVICLCTDITEGQERVAKYPFLDGRNDKIKLEKLKVEAEILKTVSHPCIVRYIDSFEEKKILYMILEYIEGKDMKTLFKERPAPESHVKKYAKKLLDALEYLHNENTIHRDITPRNIMVTQNKIKLIDFGGAKMRFTSLGQESTFLWTPGYGAPEQLWGHSYFQSDIYGVGATLYFLLTGEDPRSIPPLSPRNENPRVSKNIDILVRKAPELDPDMRFQTATEMKKALAVTPVMILPVLTPVPIPVVPVIILAHTHNVNYHAKGHVGELPAMQHAGIPVIVLAMHVPIRNLYALSNPAQYVNCQRATIPIPIYPGVSSAKIYNTIQSQLCVRYKMDLHTPSTLTRAMMYGMKP